MSLKLNSSGGGSVTLQEPTTASNVTLNLPAADGTIITTASTFAGTGPAFSAYLSTNQSISSAVSTKINIDTEEFDTNNNFASSRFTPTVAGYYQLNAFAYTFPSSGTIGTAIVSIFKNGTEYKSLNSTTASAQSAFGVSSLVYANGTTDYFELYVYNAGTSPTVLNGIANTFFNGVLARAA